MGKQLSLAGIKARPSSVLIDLRGIGYGQVTYSIEPSPKNLAYCARLRTEIIAKHRAGQLAIEDYFPKAKSSAVTFDDWADTWLSIIKPKIASTTHSEYRNNLNRFRVKWGAVPLSSITPESIITTLSAIDLKAKSFNNIVSPLRACFALARKLGKIDADLASHIEQRRKDQADGPDPLTHEEIDRVLEKAGDWWAYFATAIYTGLRPSEQIALAWGDVDLKAKTMTVRMARVRGKDKATKTSAIRTVRLPDIAHAALKQQRAISGLHDKVFVHPVSRVPLADTQPPSDAWKRICKLAGVRSRDARQTRHTYATQMLLAGVKPAFVSRQMGHANSQMFFKTYSKWLDSEDDWREIEKLNSAKNVITFVTSTAK